MVFSFGMDIQMKNTLEEPDNDRFVRVRTPNKSVILLFVLEI